MRGGSAVRRRLGTIGTIAVIAIAGFAAVALAAGVATDSKAPKLKIKCPKTVASGKKVTCRVLHGLTRGPKGDKGAKGAKGAKGERGAKGETGAKGATGSAGVSGYEIVSKTFEGVFIEDSSGSHRGLSEVLPVDCPSGKRAIGGGTDLGTNATQNGEQRSVSVSLSGPNGTGTGWLAQLFSNSEFGLTIDLKVYAICAATG
jgi:Collagen triple helix repeat (20 copies)